MPKGGRGGRRMPGGLPNGGSGAWDNSPNPYQIPNTLAEAIGPQGQPYSMAQAWIGTNPYFSENYKEFSENCQRCVMAYELRRRGYDVEALPTYENDTMPSGGWKNALKNLQSVGVGKTTENATLNSIKKQMASWGEGSRAILQIKWAGPGNSGHVLNVEQRNGRLQVFDAQNTNRPVGESYIKKYLPYATLSRTALYRTDNKAVADDMRYMVKQK